MPSPFPGMDPYLEAPAVWPAFRAKFVAAVVQTLRPGVGDAYRVAVAARTFVVEVPLFTSISKETHDEEYVEVRHRSDGRLVTLLDVATPFGKSPGPGRAAALSTRAAAEAAKAAVVEFDLLSAGESTFSFDRARLGPADQCVTVRRPSAPNQFEVYSTLYPKRLPRVRVPLADPDRDVIFETHDAFRRAYDDGGFAGILDYAAPPPAGVRMTDAVRAWAAGVAAASR